MSYVRGLQGEDLKPGGATPAFFRAIATPKHFAVHSGPDLGRRGLNAAVSRQDFFGTYLRAFRSAVTEGPTISGFPPKMPPPKP